MRAIPVGEFLIGKEQPLTVISGPCVIEGEEHALRAAAFLAEFFANKPISFIFKSSYDKANRTSLNSFRGPGLEEGLKILERIKQELGVPVFTDIHSVEEVEQAAAICDVLQIPAFLCRQTDLLLAAGRTGRVINIKKGQFMAPWDIGNAVEKLASTGNHKILLTDRGTCFGYNNLVSDFRAIPIMQNLGYPVLFDATHSVQLPTSTGSVTGGQREFIPTLARAALAAGANGIYAEAHPNPSQAKSDAACVIAFSDLPRLVDEWLRIYSVMQEICSKSYVEG